MIGSREKKRAFSRGAAERKPLRRSVKTDTLLLMKRDPAVRGAA